MRALVRWLRRRRHTETPLRIRALEVGLGLVEPTFTEAYADPDLIDWGGGRRARRERARFEALHGRPLGRGGYMAADVPASAMGPLPDVLTRPGGGWTRAAEIEPVAAAHYPDPIPREDQDYDGARRPHGPRPDVPAQAVRPATETGDDAGQ